MSFKKFRAQDVIYNTLVTKPEVNFMIHSGTVFYQRDRLPTGSFTSQRPLLKHVEQGHVNLHEMNIDRHQDSLVYSYIEKDSTRYAHRTISTSNFDVKNQFTYGEILSQSYPLSASISRIYVPSGAEFSSQVGSDAEVPASRNKKYIRALKNPIESNIRIGPSNKYGSLGTDAVNLICVPGIFYGSSIDRGSVELNYYITGALMATAKDLYSDGRLIQTVGPTTGHQIGIVVYNYGIFILSGSETLHNSHQERYFSTSSDSSPNWLTFGTGIPEVGEKTFHGPVGNSSYSVSFKGINKIPTLTMFSYAKKGECNYSHNPTFLSSSSGDAYEQSGSFYIENKRKIQKINKSDYSDYEEPYENVTYISKVGIYDENKNLIAIASLANPVKKTEKRDYMIKMKLDF